MKVKCSLILILLIWAMTPIAISAKIADLKRSAVPKSIDSMEVFEAIYPVNYQKPDNKPKFLPDVQCTVRMVGESYWAVDGWLVGDELYKVYQDVDLLNNECTYPFYITEVVFEIQSTSAGTLWVQADIETLDPEQSTEACPYPGELLAISPETSYYVPGEGYYLVVIPFDEPVLVTAPYFAGCYFGADVYLLGPSLITDNDPYLCISWNDWGEGYVDLVSNPYFNFPGNLVMYTRGYTGSGQSALSTVRIYSPADSSLQSESVTLYAAETSDTTAYEKCRFEYYSPTGWQLIGEDTSQQVTLRNGLNPASVNPGYSYTWDISSLPENMYVVRALLYVSEDSYSADTIEIYVDNTPLAPRLLNPVDGDTVCDTVTIATSIEDEDVTFLQFEIRESSDTIDIPLPLLNQYMYGDVDGDTLDWNLFSQGEYGDFYNGPTIVTSVLKYFADRGYADLMKDGQTELTIRQMVEMIADSARIRLRYGSEDDDLLATLRNHIYRQGNDFHITISDTLNLNSLLYYTAYRGGVLLLGISEPYGHWLAVRQLSMPPHPTVGTVNCMLYNSRAGTLLPSVIWFDPSLGVHYESATRDIDRVVAIYPKADTTAREIIGSDFNPSDGWSFYWDASSKPEGEYLLAAVGIDITGHVGEGTTWMSRLYATSYNHGDVNNSGEIDIDDVVYLVSYVFTGGPEPIPELAVGDTDCSGEVDIDDVVYLVSYIFTGGPPPC